MSGGAALRLVKAKRVWIAPALAVAAALALWGAAAARAATFTVTTAADGDDGSCTSSQCTLRDAIKYSSPGDTVVIPASSQPYTVSSTLGVIVIAHNLTITGAGAGSVTISGGNSTALFEISAAGVTMSGVTLTGGNGVGTSGDGGAITIDTSGNLTLTGTVVTSNSAPGGDGGSTFNQGILTVQNSTFSGNSASGGDGGAIWNDGTVTVQNSTFSGNSASGGDGGAIFNFNLGGGLALTVQNSTFSGNSSSDGDGGAIYSLGGSVTLTASTLSGNSSGDGGGLWSDVGTELTNDTISGNIATGDGGGLFLESDATPSIENVTVASNSASIDGANIYSADSGGGGGFQNTLVANPQGGTTNCNTGATFPPDQGNNLEDDAAASCGFTAASDQAGANPNLGPLAGNGGPTQTMALGPGSAAIDRGATVTSITTDQRGGPRPQPPGGAYDIGAYEVGAVVDMAISKSASPNPVTVGQALTYTLTATNTGPTSDPVYAARVTDPLPASVTFKSASASQGSCSNSSGTVTCDLGTVAKGASATVTITVTPNTPGSLTNIASVSSSALDANTANDSASTTTTVQAAGSKPTAVTGRANEFGFTFATVHGSVNPEGSATTYHFQYGRTKSYGSNTSTLSVGSASSSRAVRRKLRKLRPGTLYHYRIVARNANGTTFGRDRTFRTPQRPSLHVTPSRALAGASVRVFGNAGGCPRGDTVTLLSSAFSSTHEFAGVPAVFTRVKARGAFSTTTRIPSGRAAGPYGITARCGGGNLGVSATLTVIVPMFTG